MSSNEAPMLRIFLAFWLAVAPGPALAGSMTLMGMGGPAAATGGGCAQATTFLARTSLTGSDVTNYTNLICGMVTDGLITGNLSTTGCGSPFDVIYIFATSDSTTALLNICGTNYGGTLQGTSPPTFTAYSGFTGANLVGDYIDSNFNPSTATSPNYVQNSAHVSIWNLTNVATGIPMTSVVTGTASGQNLYPKFADNSTYARLNDNPEVGGIAIVDSRGHLLMNRSGATARQLYQNASTTLNGGATATYGSSPSQAPLNSDWSILGNDTNGSSRTAAMWSTGASLNSTQVTNFYSRLRTYMTAVGVP
jgi:hypothetical protein